MSRATKTAFQPGAGASSAWELARAQLARPRGRRLTPDELQEELALRDLVARYAYTWDLGDLEGVMSFFTDDCVITSPRGTVSGSAEICAHYDKMLRHTPRRQHLFSNVVVRLSDDLGEGWLTAYHYAILEPAQEPAHTVSGLVADHAVKLDDTWKIRARSVCVDTMAGVVASAEGAEVIDSSRSARRSRKR